jgi:hypothetical protein
MSVRPTTNSFAKTNLASSWPTPLSTTAAITTTSTQRLIDEVAKIYVPPTLSLTHRCPPRASGVGPTLLCAASKACLAACSLSTSDRYPSSFLVYARRRLSSDSWGWDNHVIMSSDTEASLALLD